MVKGNVKNEQTFADKPQVNYRALDALNQSMLKTFDTDPVKFFEEFKLGRKKKIKKNTALIIGDLTDFYLLECRGSDNEFQNRMSEQFALFDGVKGSGQVFLLADYLFEETENSLNEANEVTVSFETRFSEAFKRVQEEGKYKGKPMEKALEDFEKNGKEYFQTLLDNIGKTVVDISLVEKAKRVADIMTKDNFTTDIFCGTDDMEYLTKFPIEWIYLSTSGKEIKCKSEIDILLIDHEKKIIYLKDLKTTYDNESFEYSYIKNSYYLQDAFYYLAVEYWAKKEGLADYTIVPMAFVVGDTSANNRRPIVYETEMIDVNFGLKGFSIRGTYYRGIRQLIDEIVWCEENDIWNCSKQVFDNEGKLKLKISYDIQ